MSHQEHFFLEYVPAVFTSQTSTVKKLFQNKHFYYDTKASKKKKVKKRQLANFKIILPYCNTLKLCKMTMMTRIKEQKPKIVR